MAGFREALLRQEEPLDAYEVGVLRDWLEVLRGDVAVYGAAPEDEERMARIERRIAEADGGEPGPGVAGP